MVAGCRRQRAFVIIGNVATRICRGDRCRRRPRNIRESAAICGACLDGLAADLQFIPYLHDECERLLGGTRAARAAAVRVTGTAQPRLPFNAAAAEARAALLSLLCCWSGLASDQRRVSPPPRAVGDLVQFLSRHLSWLAAHETAPEFSRELAEAVAVARGAIDSSGLRRVQVGGCVEPGCQGTLTAIVPPDGNRSRAEISCSSVSAHRWPVPEWMRLGERMGASQSRPGERTNDGRSWLGAAEIARLRGVSVGSVYRMASELGWSRQRRDGRVYYDSAEVRRSLRVA